MKTLMIAALIMLSQLAVAQTGVNTTVENGTHLWMIFEKNPLVERLVLNYGDSEDSISQRLVISDLQALEVDSIEGQTINPETETAYVLPLLAENTGFTMGQVVCMNVQGGYLYEGQLGETSVPSETKCARLLKAPKGPKRIGIERR